MPIKAKLYIYAHIMMAISIFGYVLLQDYAFSSYKLVPFIIFGCLLELSKLNAFSINEQAVNISAGAAVIIAAIMLFNPLELIIFSFFYGIAIILFPLIKDKYKVIFNISQTINITFLGYVIWQSLFVKSSSLLTPENIIPLMVTTFSFGGFDILSIAAIVAFASGEKLIRVVKSSFDWVIVSYGLVAFMGLLLAAVYEEFYIYGLVGFIIPLFLMHYNMYLFSKEKEKQVQQLHHYNEMLKENNEELLITLSQVIDARDNSLFGHSVTVARYAMEIGNRLGLSKEQLYDLKRGSLIHDIGKLGISENILQKPGRLTDEEFTIVKTHTVIGEKIINKTKGMEKVATIIGQHHEHYNGKGYPRQLKEEEILIESRIVTLCDSIETMLSTRSYKEGRPLEDVVAEVKRCSGTHFDPQVAEIFFEIANEKGSEFFYNSAEKDHNLEMKNLLLEHSR